MGQGGSGLLNTYWGLIIPEVSSAYGIFLLTQFFKTLPSDLEDAARIDGCSEPGVYWRIILPLSKPALATLGVLAFMSSWNAYLWPLIVTSTDDMATVQVGLSLFQTRYSTNWRLLMAGSVIATIPLIIAFVSGQKYFTRGIALTGLKG